MPNETLERGTYKQIRLWWLFLVMSLVIFAVSALAFITTKGNYTKLSPYFTITVITIAVLATLITVVNHQKIHAWGLNLAASLLVLPPIVFILINPDFPESVFAFYVGFALLFSSFISNSYSFSLKGLGNRFWWISFVFSLITVLLIILLLLYPIHEQLTLMLWTSAAFACLGLTYLISGFLFLYTNLMEKKKLLFNLQTNL